MLNLVNEGTPVPQKITGVYGKKFWYKEAIGVPFWNGLRGDECEVFMITQERQLKEGEPKITVIRSPGGSKVPVPFSMESSFVESLVRVQQYFDNEITVTRECAADWIPLHQLWVSSVKIYKTPNNIGTYAPSQGALVDYGGPVTHNVMDAEIHGVWPISQEVVKRFRHKLEKIWLDGNGKVKAESGRPFNNVGLIMVMRHILGVLQTPGPTDFDTLVDSVLSEINPPWENDDYAPCHDA